MTATELLPPRYYALAGAALVCVVAWAAALIDPRWLLLALAAGALCGVGINDLVQTRHAICRNYPILAHIRFFFEEIRPEIRQYLLESDHEAVPFSRAQRSLVYQRAKNVEDKKPFGTGMDFYLAGYEWINHSIRPVKIADSDFRVTVGGKHCTRPYSCSLFICSVFKPRTNLAGSVWQSVHSARLGKCQVC